MCRDQPGAALAMSGCRPGYAYSKPPDLFWTPGRQRRDFRLPRQSRQFSGGDPDQDPRDEPRLHWMVGGRRKARGSGAAENRFAFEVHALPSGRLCVRHVTRRNNRRHTGAFYCRGHSHPGHDFHTGRARERARVSAVLRIHWFQWPQRLPRAAFGEREPPVEAGIKNGVVTANSANDANGASTPEHRAARE